MKHPPARLCHPCQDAWAAWTDAEFPAHLLDGGGEGRRRQIIATQQADVVARCEAAGHERTRSVVVSPPAVEVAAAPASLLGARIKSILDEFEALLPPDPRTREEKVAAAVEQMRADHLHLKRTGHHRPLPTAEEVA